MSRDEELLRVDTKRNAYKIGLVDFPLERFDMFKDPPWDVPEGIIVGVAPYGVFINKHLNPAQPMTPDEAIREFEACIPLGAVALHTHARDERGNITDVARARDYLAKVTWPLKEKYGDRVVFDGGVGYYGRTVEDNLFVVREGFVEVAIVNPSVGQMGDYVLGWSPRALQAQAEYCESHGVRVLMDIHDTNSIRNAKEWLIDAGVVRKPYLWHLLGPMPGGFLYAPNVRRMVQGLLYMVELIKEIDEDSIIIVTQPHRASMYFITLAIMLGLHIRVGMEDAIYRWPHRKDLIPDNRTIVADAIAVARALGRRPLEAAEYRRLIGLKG